MEKSQSEIGYFNSMLKEQGIETIWSDIEQPKKQPPKLTKKAQIYISSVLKNKEFFRVTVNSGGCSGLQYNFSIDTVVSEEDIIFSESPRAITDKESINYLYGAELHWEQSAFSGQMLVKNPNSTASCGCGNSFAF